MFRMTQLISTPFPFPCLPRKIHCFCTGFYYVLAADKLNIKGSSVTNIASLSHKIQNSSGYQGVLAAIKAHQWEMRCPFHQVVHDYVLRFSMMKLSSLKLTARPFFWMVYIFHSKNWKQQVTGHSEHWNQKVFLLNSCMIVAAISELKKGLPSPTCDSSPPKNPPWRNMMYLTWKGEGEG